MSEKGGTLFLLAIIVILAGVLLTFLRPMFNEALNQVVDYVRDFYANVGETVSEAIGGD